jgi:hypothetical protein
MSPEVVEMLMSLASESVVDTTDVAFTVPPAVIVIGPLAVRRW